MSTATMASEKCDAPFAAATSPQLRAGPVIVALDDDGNAGTLLRRGRDLAARLGVALRAVYIWSDCRPPECPHHRRCHRDLEQASRLLTALLDEHLTAAAAAAAAADRIEREVVHDTDPADALVALSAEASYLVMGASSDDGGARDPGRLVDRRCGCGSGLVHPSEPDRRADRRRTGRGSLNTGGSTRVDAGERGAGQ